MRTLTDFSVMTRKTILEVIPNFPEPDKLIKLEICITMLLMTTYLEGAKHFRDNKIDPSELLEEEE